MLDALRVRGAAYLLLTALIGRLPTGMSSLAIVRLVRDQGGDYSLAALLTAVYILTGTVGQPLLSRMIDRTGRPRPVLLSSAFAAAAALCLLAFTAVTLPLVAVLLAAVAGFATPPLESCLRSLWTRIMTPGIQLNAAFSVDAAAQEVMFVAAPLVTALGILLFGAQGNMLLMAGLGLAGTVLFAANGRIGQSKRAVGAGADADADTDATSTGRAKPSGTPLSIPSFRSLALVQVAVGIPIGVLTISATGFGELVNGESVSALGLAVNALGAFIGAIFVARHVAKRPPHTNLRIIAIVLALLYLPTAIVGAPVGVWLVFALLAGISLPPLLTQTFAQTAASVPAAQLNEANAWIVSAFTVGIAAGTLGAGLIVEALPGASGIVVAVIAGSAAALLGALVATPRRLDPTRLRTAASETRVA